MNLVGYTATALSRNDIEDTPTNKNVVDFAIVELKDLHGNLVVMYDDAEGANPETQKTCDTNGQVTFFAEAGDYDVEINGKAQRINLSSGLASSIETSDGRSVQERLDDLPSEVDAAGTAAALISQHNEDESAHPDLSAFITAEADRAEVAADAASASGNIYADTAAGLAATVDGDYFSVVSPSDENYLDLYLNDGGSAVLQKSYPSTDFLTSKVISDDDSHAVSGIAVSDHVRERTSINDFDPVIDAFGTTTYTFTNTAPILTPIVSLGDTKGLTLSLDVVGDSDPDFIAYLYTQYTDGSKDTHITYPDFTGGKTTVHWDESLFSPNENKTLLRYEWRIYRGRTDAGVSMTVTEHAYNSRFVTEKNRIEINQLKTEQDDINNDISKIKNAVEVNDLKPVRDSYGSLTYTFNKSTAELSKIVSFNVQGLIISCSITGDPNPEFNAYLYARYTDGSTSILNISPLTFNGSDWVVTWGVDLFATDANKTLSNYEWRLYRDANKPLGVEVTITKHAYLTSGLAKYNSEIIESIIENPPSELTYEPDFRNINYTAMTPITVKLDGSGDYTKIQDAINYAKTQSPSLNNQFDIQLFDDHYFDSTLQLYTLSGALNTTPLPETYLSAFVTEDYIHVRGIGDRKVVEILPMTEESDPSFDYSRIQTLYSFGNSVIDNVDTVITKGRYAVHHDSDYNEYKTTIYKNTDCVYRGDDKNASGNGTASGTRLIYDNVNFITAHTRSYANHQTPKFTNPDYLRFENCKFVSKANLNAARLYLTTLGSGVRGTLEVNNSDVTCVEIINNIHAGIENTVGHEWGSQSVNIKGGGNTPTIFKRNNVGTLKFETDALNKTVVVTGGDAKDLIYGKRDYAFYPGVVDATGISVGNIRADGEATLTLAARLGDCSTVNKTLTIEIDGVEQVIVFNKDYTSLTNSDVLTDINAAITGVNATIGDYKEDLINFPDCLSSGFNSSNATIERGMLVKRNGLGFELADEGDTPFGVSNSRSNPSEPLTVSIMSKCMFNAIDINGISADGLYKCGSSGVAVPATDSDAKMLVVGRGVSAY